MAGHVEPFPLGTGAELRLEASTAEDCFDADDGADGAGL
jgi:hypothetical protein